MKHLTHARSMTVVITLVASAGIALAACGGSSTTSPSATSVVTAPSAVAATLAAVDPCLVGTWTTVGETQNSPADDEQITYSGGDGEIFKIDAQGGVTIDTHAAHKVVFVSSGETFSATVAGTGQGTLTTSTVGSARSFHFEPGAADTRTTHSLGPDGVELGPPRADTAFTASYTCAPGRFTFYKTAVNYMIDGPIVELTSGTGTASSTASPAPS
jgi:hypothetical protein